MNPSLAPKLATLLDNYYNEELDETARLFGLELRFDDFENDTAWRCFASPVSR